MLSVISTAGYYAAYGWVILRTLQGHFDIGTLTFLMGAILQASGSLQQVFATLSGIGRPGFVPYRPAGVLRDAATVKSKPNALPIPKVIREGFEFRNVSFAYPGTTRRVLSNFNLVLEPAERIALIGEKRPGKDDRCQADDTALRPHRGADSTRWRRPA